MHVTEHFLLDVQEKAGYHLKFYHISADEIVSFRTSTKKILL